MAATIRATVGVDRVPSIDSPETSPRAHIARLAELHDEAAETALLANLLGRVPFLAVVLLAATGALALFTHAAVAPLLTWLSLVGAGLIALVRNYVVTIGVPFERTSLRLFARDLQAIMLYVGFAWGAGSFLALPQDATLALAVALSAGLAAIVALIVRASDAVACFAIPATVLSAIAALIHPVAGNYFAAAAILAAGLAVMGAAYFAERALLSPQDQRFAAMPGGSLPV
jgi:hypothetical protein